jgi:hypothetical protein
MNQFCLAVLIIASSTPAAAAPGIGEKVYEATIEPGVTEVEARYGRLAGGPATGEDGLVLEFSHAFGPRLYGGLLTELARDPGRGRQLEAVGLEAIVAIGRVQPLGLDVALYGEYENAREGGGRVETKLLVEHRKGPFDGRLNLIFGKDLKSGAPLETGYAASADWRAVEGLRLGVEAFGDMGTSRHFLPRAEHYAGPMVKTGLEHLPGRGELEIEAGYLFALGAARDEARGQARLLLEYEFHF